MKSTDAIQIPDEDMADLDEQASERYECIVRQMKATEGEIEEMKTSQQLIWVQRMNSIRNQVGEIFLVEIIYS